MVVRAILDLLGAIFIHIIIVAVLGLIGFFVWNTGLVGIASNLRNISYLTSTAIMLGLYILNLFVKTWINRVKGYKQQQELIEILNRMKDN